MATAVQWWLHYTDCRPVDSQDFKGQFADLIEAWRRCSDKVTNAQLQASREKWSTFVDAAYEAGAGKAHKYTKLTQAPEATLVELEDGSLNKRTECSRR